MGTVSSVGSGAGLTGGPITGSGTLSIASGGVTNAMLANPSLTVTAGLGLSGGGAVALGGSTSLSIASGGVTNAMLANPSLTVTAGTDLTGGGSVALGSSVTVNLDTTKVPTLGASSNTFTGSVSAASFSGVGTGLTSLNASNLSSGTLPPSVLSGTYSQAVTFSNASNSFSGNGAGLTNLTPGNLSTGTAGINISGNAATAGNAAELGGLGAGAFAQLGAGSNTFTGSIAAPNLLVTGVMSGPVPVTITTGASVSVGTNYSLGYYFNQDPTAGAAITYTLPTASAGKQYCVGNSYNGSAANTGTLEIATSASGQYIIWNGTLSNSGGYIISGGAAGDKGCVVGVDSSHWEFFGQQGVWALH
jgi:hypothetical protein